MFTNQVRILNKLNTSSYNGQLRRRGLPPPRRRQPEAQGLGAPPPGQPLDLQAARQVPQRTGRPVRRGHPGQHRRAHRLIGATPTLAPAKLRL